MRREIFNDYIDILEARDALPGIGDPSPCCLQRSGSVCRKMSTAPECKRTVRRAIIGEHVEFLEARHAEADAEADWESEELYMF